MIKSIKEPVLTLTIHLTSPMIRMEAEPEGAGATTPLEGPPGGMTPPPPGTSLKPGQEAGTTQQYHGCVQGTALWDVSDRNMM